MIQGFEIKIGDDYIITADPYNFILSERVELEQSHKWTKGTHRWNVGGYFGKLEHALSRLAQNSLKASECDSIRDL